MAPLLTRKTLIMKRHSAYIILLVAVLIASSCSKKKQNNLQELQEKYLPKAEMALTKQDSIEVLNLTEHYLQLIKENNLDDAIGMLYYLRGDSLMELPKELADGHRMMLKRIKGIRYEINHLTFIDEKNSEVKYKVTLFDRKKGDTRPNEIAGYVKPVRRDGKWYLTIANTMTESNNELRIKD